MPGTFGYTESTNTVVVTGGTSGSPADFASFVTADRAGTDTDLLVAGSPASDLALTYAVRPVEDLAILVKCIVANKTAQADFIFITGKDWRGAAQTESIDVTAGNGSYTSTKYWSEITTLDCSDNAAGGGAVWGDGDLSVTQDVWGVIWDYGESMYRVDSHFDVGNGSTSTYFQSMQELVTFISNMEITLKGSATLEIGDLSGDYGIKGSCWKVYFNEGSYHQFNAAGDFKLYGSYIMHMGNSNVAFDGGTIDIRNSLIECNYVSDNSWRRRFEFETGTIDVDGLCYTNARALLMKVNPNSFSRFHGHACGFAIDCQAANIEAVNPKITNSINADAYTQGAGRELTYLNPVNAISSPWIFNNDSAIYEKYTCNIKVCDKDGTALQDVVVDCEDQTATAVWAVGTITTDASGDIAEQTITYKKWVDDTETLTTYSPHKFTISKAGHETLVLENITVDGAIDWHLELQDPVAGYLMGS